MKRIFFLSLVVLSNVACLDFTKALDECKKKGDCVDEAAPILSNTTPENQAKDVNANTVLSFQFSQSMKTDSVKIVVAPPIQLGQFRFEDDDTRLTVQPLAPLTFGASYVVTVTGDSTNGRTLMNSSFSFSVQAAPDMAAPTLLSSIPANAATQVAVNTKLVLSFSEAMRTDGIELVTEPDFDWGLATWSAGNTIATFAAPTNGAKLEQLKEYSVVVSAKDQSENAMKSVMLHFTTTEAPDMQGPTVSSTAPSTGAVSVPPNAALSVTFSEPVNKDSPPVEKYFTVTPAVPCDFTWDATKTTVTCSHSKQPNLAVNTLYTVNIGASDGTVPRDAKNNPLAAPFSFSFTTGAIPDTTTPNVTVVTPGPNATGVTACSSLQLQFSEAMDKTATQMAVSVSQPANVTLTPQWSTDEAPRLFLKPSADLPLGATVNWQINTGATDLAGNHLALTQNYSFKTLSKTPAPRQVSGSTGDGYVGRLSSATSGVTQVNQDDVLIMVGDRDTLTKGKSLVHRAVLEFALSNVPKGAQLISARLYVHQYDTAGSPFDATKSPRLGSLLAEPVAMKSINDAFDARALLPEDYCPPCMKCRSATFCLAGKVCAPSLSSVAGTGWRSLAVTDAVQAALVSQKIQFRLRFSELDSNANAIADYVRFDSADSTAVNCTGEPTNPTNACKPYLLLEYYYP